MVLDWKTFSFYYNMQLIFNLTTFEIQLQQEPLAFYGTKLKI